MKNNPVVRESLTVLLGELVGTGLMFCVFALLHRFDVSVLVGGLVGAILTSLNFFFLSVSVSVAVNRAQNGNPKGGQGLVALSRTIRMIVLFGLMALFAWSGYCNVLALVVPLVFQQPTLLLCEFFRKSGEDKK